MNIFYLDKDPVTCARMHNDKHVVKMIIEYAQLMSTAHRVLDGIEYIGRTANNRKIKRWRHPDPAMETGLMKASHVNHPSAKWTRQSNNNYIWLYYLWRALCNEYTHRYGKIHACEKYAKYLQNAPKNIPAEDLTQPTPAMQAYAECIVPGDSRESYRNYYKIAKASFNNYTKRQKPEWLNDAPVLCGLL